MHNARRRRPALPIRDCRLSTNYVTLSSRHWTAPKQPLSCHRAGDDDIRQAAGRAHIRGELGMLFKGSSHELRNAMATTFKPAPVTSVFSSILNISPRMEMVRNHTPEPTPSLRSLRDLCTSRAPEGHSPALGASSDVVSGWVSKGTSAGHGSSPVSDLGVSWMYVCVCRCALLRAAPLCFSCDGRHSACVCGAAAQ